MFNHYVNNGKLVNNNNNNDIVPVIDEFVDDRVGVLKGLPALVELGVLVPGVYKVPYNLIFFPTPLF